MWGEVDVACDDDDTRIWASVVMVYKAGSLNRDAGDNASANATVAATADSTDSKKTWIFKSFSRIT